MSALFTKDPNKAGLRLTTTDPSKGFGGSFFKSLPDEELTDEQKELRYRSGAMERPQSMKRGGIVGCKKGGSVRGAGCATRGVKKCKVY